jgi:hypothetical protein
MEFVIGGILYFLLLVTVGIISIRKGHWVMFIIGISSHCSGSSGR